MNTKKTIYDKLFKEETQLAKHEIELALADDIKASLSAYKGLKDNVEKTKNAAKNSFIKYSDSVRVAYQNAKNSVDLITKLEVEAKKLGIGDTGYGGWKKESTAKMSEYKSLLTAIDKIYQSI